MIDINNQRHVAQQGFLSSLGVLLMASEGLMRTACNHFAACNPHGFYSQR